MSARLIYSIYSKDSGLEITPEIKVNANKNQSEGRVHLRFFLLKTPGEGGKTTQLIFVMEPFEAFAISQAMLDINTNGGKEKYIHKYGAGEAETVTTLTVERWVRGEKSGLGLALGRGDAFISVPVGKESVGRFLFGAEFLRSMSVRQSWIDREAA